MQCITGRPSRRGKLYVSSKKRKELDMNNLFDDRVIDTDAVEALTEEELDIVLAILTKAGY